MPLPSTETLHYTRVAKIFHWLIAAAILFQLALGWIFDSFSGETKFFLLQLHKSIGITILLLSLARLGWRFAHHAPPLPGVMPVWEQRAAHIGHFFLYAAMIGMPLTGWALVSASPRNIPTILYGVLPWPNIPVLPTLANKAAVSHFMGGLHGYGAYLFAALIVGHVAAALRHHFFVRDDILLRMAPHGLTGVLKRLRGEA
jgi:cytochrome b561